MIMFNPAISIIRVLKEPFEIGYCANNIALQLVSFVILSVVSAVALDRVLPYVNSLLFRKKSV